MGIDGMGYHGDHLKLFYERTGYLATGKHLSSYKR